VIEVHGRPERLDGVTTRTGTPTLAGRELAAVWIGMTPFTTVVGDLERQQRPGGCLPHQGRTRFLLLEIGMAVSASNRQMAALQGELEGLVHGGIHLRGDEPRSIVALQAMFVLTTECLAMRLDMAIDAIEGSEVEGDGRSPEFPRCFARLHAHMARLASDVVVSAPEWKPQILVIGNGEGRFVETLHIVTCGAFTAVTALLELTGVGVGVAVRALGGLQAKAEGGVACAMATTASHLLVAAGKRILRRLVSSDIESRRRESIDCVTGGAILSLTTKGRLAVVFVGMTGATLGKLRQLVVAIAMAGIACRAGMQAQQGIARLLVIEGILAQLVPAERLMAGGAVQPEAALVDVLMTRGTGGGQTHPAVVCETTGPTFSDVFLVEARRMAAITLDLCVLAIQSPAGLRVIEALLAASRPFDDLEILAAVLRMTVSTLAGGTAGMKTAILLAQESDFLVTRQALAFHMALADFMTLQTVGDAFQVGMRRRQWTR